MRCAAGDAVAAGMIGADDGPPCPIVEVEFKGGRREQFENALGLDLRAGDAVIVEADRGTDYGIVHLAGPLMRVRLRSIGRVESDDFPGIVRRASADDTTRFESLRARERDSFLAARRTIERMSLPMKLVDVEWQFDEKRVTFYFTSDQRVDFRELVRRLARRFRTRVELRQIGARDEAARVGGIGSCGRTLCCARWLPSFRPVTTQAAKTQNLTLNPVRLSGQCGRLKCCLNYELRQYVDALRAFPPLDTPIALPGGTGRVSKVDVLREQVRVQMPGGDWVEMSLDEARALLDG